jgi:hypothetical protein
MTGMNRLPDTELYGRDFFAWVQHNVGLLRRGCVEQVDWAHIVEQMEALAKSERREVSRRLLLLVVYLLKWKYQPRKRYTRTGRSFRLSAILEERRRLEMILKQSPSLKLYAASSLTKHYRHAAERTASETGISFAQFPAECPFTLDQVRDKNFLPD